MSGTASSSSTRSSHADLHDVVYGREPVRLPCTEWEGTRRPTPPKITSSLRSSTPHFRERHRRPTHPAGVRRSGGGVDGRVGNPAGGASRVVPPAQGSIRRERPPPRRHTIARKRQSLASALSTDPPTYQGRRQGDFRRDRARPRRIARNRLPSVRTSDNGQAKVSAKSVLPSRRGSG
jgi:hypothetical protein